MKKVRFICGGIFSMVVSIMFVSGCVQPQYQQRNSQRTLSPQEKLSKGAGLGDLAMVENALNSGAQINQVPNPAICHAVINGQLEMTKYLVSKGASLKVGCSDGLWEMPLIFSLNSITKIKLDYRKNYLEVLRFLVKEKGMDINQKGNNDIRAFSQLLQAYAPTTDEEIDSMKQIIATYLELGADINGKDNVGHTPLMYHIFFDPSPKIVEYLIKKGAKVNATRTGGMTAMDFAEQKGNQEVIQILKKNGARKGKG